VARRHDCCFLFAQRSNPGLLSLSTNSDNIPPGLRQPLALWTDVCSAIRSLAVEDLLELEMELKDALVKTASETTLSFCTIVPFLVDNAKC